MVGRYTCMALVPGFSAQRDPAARQEYPAADHRGALEAVYRNGQIRQWDPAVGAGIIAIDGGRQTQHVGPLALAAEDEHAVAMGHAGLGVSPARPMRALHADTGLRTFRRRTEERVGKRNRVRPIDFPE